MHSLPVRRCATAFPAAPAASPGRAPRAPQLTQKKLQLQFKTLDSVLQVQVQGWVRMSCSCAGFSTLGVSVQTCSVRWPLHSCAPWCCALVPPFVRTMVLRAGSSIRAHHGAVRWPLHLCAPWRAACRICSRCWAACPCVRCPPAQCATRSCPHTPHAPTLLVPPHSSCPHTPRAPTLLVPPHSSCSIAWPAV